jgi:hypothetical protein
MFYGFDKVIRNVLYAGTATGPEVLEVTTASEGADDLEESSVGRESFPSITSTVRV